MARTRSIKREKEMACPESYSCRGGWAMSETVTQESENRGKRGLTDSSDIENYQLPSSDERDSCLVGGGSGQYRLPLGTDCETDLRSVPRGNFICLRKFEGSKGHGGFLTLCVCFCVRSWMRLQSMASGSTSCQTLTQMRMRSSRSRHEY